MQSLQRYGMVVAIYRLLCEVIIDTLLSIFKSQHVIAVCLLGGLFTQRNVKERKQIKKHIVDAGIIWSQYTMMFDE